jgi:hypothetical protein
MQDRAALSYANREFGDAVQTLNELVQRQSDNPRWYEMRAQVNPNPAHHVSALLGSALLLAQPSTACAFCAILSKRRVRHILCQLQVLVDGKEFRSAIKDFDRALQLYPGAHTMIYVTISVHALACL